ncbi:MAG: recombinase family protein [Gemmataceae bacterium]|nr:recombinase family protein [Gemmataceae bacterium]MCI0739968.1 recombinase family protein [Gemmataceae bacterium]
MDDTTRVALYARVSSARQADELTIQSQVAALRQRIAADRCKLEPELCFLDEGFSGSTMLRPALERLRDLAYSGVIDRLYVHSPDRLARRYAYQVVLLMEELNKHAVEVVFLNDVAGIASPEGNLLVQMQGMIAEYERAKILERTRRGRRFAARQGKISALAHAPYGYRYVSKHDGGGEARYEVVPEYSQHVQALFTWVGIEGLSLGQAARRLRDQGVPTPTAHAAKMAVPTTAAEQEAIAVPALVSAELFQAAAAKLAENRRRYREQKKGAEFLLSGFLICGRCNSAYCGRRHRVKPRAEYVYYRCIGTDRYRHDGDRICTNASLNGRIEQAVWSDLCVLLQDPERLRREFEERLHRPAHDKAEVTRLEQALVQHKRRIARLIDAYENGWLDKAEFEPRVRTAKERLTRDETALQEHQRDSIDAEELRLVIGQFDAFAAQMTANLEQADFATKRKLLRLLIKRVEVTEQEVRIIYKVSFRPFVQSPSSGGFLQDCLKFHKTPSG